MITTGISAGDYILKTIAYLLKSLIRQNDLLFRYGGDEFCVFTSHNLEVLSSIAKRIVLKVKAYDFQFENQSIPTHVSVGFCR